MSQHPDFDFEKRISALEKKVYTNERQLRRGKNAKAVLVLGVFLFMVFEFESPLPWGGRIKSSKLGTPEIAQIMLLGAWAVGAIALEDFLGLKIKTSKPSERDGTTGEREG